MKRTLTVLLAASGICFLNVATLAVLIGLGGLNVTVAGPAPDPSCGDVDGSGSVQLGDAIYLLGYLFGNGPDLACAQPPDPTTCSCWPPSPEDIVYVTGDVSLASTDELVLFDVPDDHYLVLTNVFLAGSQAMELRFRDSLNNERFVGTASSSMQSYSNSVGIPSFLGGELYVINSDTNPGNDTLQWAITGYIVSAVP